MTNRRIKVKAERIREVERIRRNFDWALSQIKEIILENMKNARG